MGFFKELKENYNKEFVDEPKNKIEWFPLMRSMDYKFLVSFLNKKRPVELTIEEVIDLYHRLKEFRDSFPKDDEFSKENPYPERLKEVIKAKNWKLYLKEYPYHFLNKVLWKLSYLIKQSYKEYSYLYDELLDEN